VTDLTPSGDKTSYDFDVGRILTLIRFEPWREGIKQDDYTD
jgi:hypothetical protein